MVEKPDEDEREESVEEEGSGKTTMPHDGLFADGMARPNVYLEFFDEKLPTWLKKAIVPGFFMVIARYIIQVTNLEPALLKQEAASRINQRAGEVFMSTANRLREKGKEEGAVKTLHMQLKEKFKEVPDWVYEKVEQATPDVVDQWLIRVLSRDRIQDVFA